MRTEKRKPRPAAAVTASWGRVRAAKGAPAGGPRSQEGALQGGLGVRRGPQDSWSLKQTLRRCRYILLMLPRRQRGPLLPSRASRGPPRVFAKGLLPRRVTGCTCRGPCDRRPSCSLSSRGPPEGPLKHTSEAYHSKTLFIELPAVLVLRTSATVAAQRRGAPRGPICNLPAKRQPWRASFAQVKAAIF